MSRPSASDIRTVGVSPRDNAFDLISRSAAHNANQLSPTQQKVHDPYPRRPVYLVLSHKQRPLYRPLGQPPRLRDLVKNRLLKGKDKAIEGPTEEYRLHIEHIEVVGMYKTKQKAENCMRALVERDGGQIALAMAQHPTIPILNHDGNMQTVKGVQFLRGDGVWQQYWVYAYQQ